MPAKELIYRLIEDVNTSIRNRAALKDLKTQTGLTPVQKSFQALIQAKPVRSVDIGVFDKLLIQMAQLINEGLIMHQDCELLNIHRFLKDLTVNKEKIVERVQYILDGKMGIPASISLRERFELIHKFPIQ